MLGGLGEKHPQMPASGEVGQLLLFQRLCCTHYYGTISQAAGP